MNRHGRQGNILDNQIERNFSSRRAVSRGREEIKRNTNSELILPRRTNYNQENNLSTSPEPRTTSPEPITRQNINSGLRSGRTLSRPASPERHSLEDKSLSPEPIRGHKITPLYQKFEHERNTPIKEAISRRISPERITPSPARNKQVIVQTPISRRNSPERIIPS